MDLDSVYLGRRANLGSLELLSSGKVRDIYRAGPEQLLFVTSDRVSAFDVLLEQGIPHKGRVLTSIAAHWFQTTRHIIDNHLISTDVADVPGLAAEDREALRGRVMLVHACRPTTVEWVVRGYICGSGWKEYLKSGSICGNDLPPGLRFCERFERPIFTPTTKDHDHDLPLSPAEARERVGTEIYDQAYTAAMRLFEFGTDRLAEIGILLADTKYEFGTRDGKVLLIDEAMTPDSSRFWPADDYEVGRTPDSFDKQILRNWLEEQEGWDKTAPAPEPPPEIIARLTARYLEVCEMITGSTPAGVPA